MYRYFCFVPNLIQIIIDIMMLGYRPNIHLKLNKAFLQEFPDGEWRCEDP